MLANRLLRVVNGSLNIEKAREEINDFISAPHKDYTTEKEIEKFVKDIKREELRGYFTHNDYNIITDSALLIASKKDFKLKKSKASVSFSKILDNTEIINKEYHSDIDLTHLLNACKLTDKEKGVVVLKFADKVITLSVKLIETLVKCTNFKESTIYAIKKENSPIYINYGKPTMAVLCPIKGQENATPDFYVLKDGSLSVLESDNLATLSPEIGTKKAKSQNKVLKVEKCDKIDSEKTVSKKSSDSDSQDKAKDTNDDEPATNKQLAYLQVLTGETPKKGLTKKEASKLITKAKKGRK
jgi:hypothetical protein